MILQACHGSSELVSKVAAFFGGLLGIEDSIRNYGAPDDTETEVPMQRRVSQITSASSYPGSSSTKLPKIFAAEQSTPRPINNINGTPTADEVVARRSPSNGSRGSRVLNTRVPAQTLEIVSGACTSFEDIPTQRATTEENVPDPAVILHSISLSSKDSSETSKTTSTSNSYDVSSNSYPNSKKLTVPQRYALSIAKSPTKHFSIALFISISLSIIAVSMGSFQIGFNPKGWQSKGTLIADRTVQQMLIEGEIMYETQEVPLDSYCNGTWYGSEAMLNPQNLNLVALFHSKSPKKSALEAAALHELCVSEENALMVLEERDLCHKCPVDSSSSKCIQPYSLVALARLYLYVITNGAPPTALEFTTPSISCDSLRNKWTSTIQSEFTSILADCSDDAMELAHLKTPDDGRVSKCLRFPIMPVTLVDNQFSHRSPVVRYTASIYATKTDDVSIKRMYDADFSGLFKTPPRVDSPLQPGVFEVGMNSLYYTTRDGLSFYLFQVEQRLTWDLGIAVGSLIATSICIMIHTRSTFLTMIGLLQITLALPISYYLYYFVFGIPYFPLVNVNAIFIVFALGADDIFVVVDKWKNTRHRLRVGATTEEVAVVALPHAASATFVTSITTSVAFLASAMMKVPAIKAFAIFCGLLVMSDYVLSVVLMFPALCLYDRCLFNGQKSACLVACGRAKDGNTIQTQVVDDEECKFPLSASGASLRMEELSKEEVCNGPREEHTPIDISDHDQISLTEGRTMHRVLDLHYKFIHHLRWLLLALSVGAIVVCGFFAAKLRAPDQPEPSFLPSNNRYEIHRTWSQSLLANTLLMDRFGRLSFIWGIIPADTAHRLNPDDTSILVHDDTFNPKTLAAQAYLLEVCDRIHKDVLTRKDLFECPMQKFNTWLQEQSQSSAPTMEYRNLCGNATSIPVQPEIFDPCMISFSMLTNTSGIFQDEGVVNILTIQARTNSTHRDPINEQGKEWHALETWLDHERINAPYGVNNFFFNTIDFAVYDTMNDLVSSATSSGLISLACASAMILLTSRSALMMLFSAISIAYVLLAASACVLGLGWKLGVFESVLFGVLIGVGCDFVLHFSHTYTMLPGVVHREVRTRYALLQMGPSVLGSAATTMLTAIIMMFTEILFFRKFAIMLAMTVLHSTIASFIVFLVLCDCFGPAEPRKGYNTIKSKLCGRKERPC